MSGLFAKEPINRGFFCERDLVFIEPTNSTTSQEVAAASHRRACAGEYAFFLVGVACTKQIT